MGKTNNIVLAAAKKVLIAPVGELKTNAVDLGYTNGGIVITVESTKSDVFVDQSVMAVRSITNQVKAKIAIPLAEITPDNIAKAFGQAITTTSGVSTLKPNLEQYYQVWVQTDGPIDAITKKTKTREYYFEKISFTGSSSITLNKTDAQVLNIEGNVYVDPDETTAEIELATIEDVVPA